MNRHRILWLGVIGALALSCARATTHEPRVAEQQEVTITCELTQAPKWSDIPVFESATDCLAATGTYHYVLWLPKGYLADTQRRWPCMFIADGGGHAKMGNMAAWLKARGYVVVMLVESKNGQQYVWRRRRATHRRVVGPQASPNQLGGNGPTIHGKLEEVLASCSV